MNDVSISSPALTTQPSTPTLSTPTLSTPTLSAPLSSTPLSITEQTRARLEKTAEEFEALVLSQLLEPIFSSVETSELTSGGPGEDAYQAMMQQEYAKSIAARGGLGIADQVLATLIELQADPAIGAPDFNPIAPSSEF